jgi:hypothetical protein
LQEAIHGVAFDDRLRQIQGGLRTCSSTGQRQQFESASLGVGVFDKGRPFAALAVEYLDLIAALRAQNTHEMVRSRTVQHDGLLDGRRQVKTWKQELVV